MPRSIKVVAQDLARAHRKADRKTNLIKYFPTVQQDEIRLLEVSTGAPSTGEVLPFRFAADRANRVDYPSVVILLSPEDWDQVEKKALALPSDWDLQTAEDL